MIGGDEGIKRGKNTEELRLGPLTSIRDYRSWRGNTMRSFQCSDLGIPMSSNCPYKFVVTDEQMKQFRDQEYPLGDIPEPMHKYITEDEDGRKVDETAFWIVREMGENW